MDQQIGGALRIAIVAAMYAIGAQPCRFVPGLSLAFVGAVVIALVAVGIAMRVCIKNQPMT